MASVRCRLLFVLATLLAAASTGASSGAGLEEAAGWASMRRPSCQGTVGECLAAGGSGEFELGSEVGRRFLASSSYISYTSLSRDSVPCSARGASYYNCRPGASANPYSRSCSSITQCRG